METIVQEISNVGFTLFCVVMGIMIVRWLDRKVFNKTWRIHEDDDNR